MKKVSTADVIAVNYLGKVSIALVIAFAMCFLANLGYNTYIKIHNKEIEARTESFNSISD